MPCFFSPNRKSGIFRISRNTDIVQGSGVICESRIDVPDIPLSYRFTGAKKVVTPNALTHPAISRNRKFCPFRCFSSASLPGIFKVNPISSFV